MSRLLVPVVCFLFALWTVSEAAPRQACANWQADLDREGATVFMLGDRSLKIPATMEELNTGLCPSILNAGSNLRNTVKKCLSAFPKTVAGLAVRGTRILLKQKCTSEPEKERIVRYLQCVQDQENLDRLHDVIDTFNRKLVAMQSTIADNKLGVLCCSYVQTRQDLESTTAQMCGPEATAYAMELVDGMLREALDLACSNFMGENTAKCLPVWQQNPLNVTTDSAKPSKSFLLPLVEVLTSLS